MATNYGLPAQAHTLICLANSTEGTGGTLSGSCSAQEQPAKARQSDSGGLFLCGSIISLPRVKTPPTGLLWAKERAGGGPQDFERDRRGYPKWSRSRLPHTFKLGGSCRFTWGFSLCSLSVRADGRGGFPRGSLGVRLRRRRPSVVWGVRDGCLSRYRRQISRTAAPVFPPPVTAATSFQLRLHRNRSRRDMRMKGSSMALI